LFEFKKALFRKEVIERSPTDQELDHLAEKLSVDLYQRYLNSLKSKPLDLQGSIKSLNKQLFASDTFKDAKKEKQDALAKTFRELTDKVEEKLQKFRVMSPHQLQLAKNRERALSESPPGGGQFSPPPMMSSLPAFIIDDGDSDSAFAPIKRIGPAYSWISSSFFSTRAISNSKTRYYNINWKSIWRI
jgi:nucleotidyltransferase/DNA polymerase involved in DNA repair